MYLQKGLIVLIVLIVLNMRTFRDRLCDQLVEVHLNENVRPIHRISYQYIGCYMFRTFVAKCVQSIHANIVLDRLHFHAEDFVHARCNLIVC